VWQLQGLVFVTLFRTHRDGKLPATVDGIAGSIRIDRPPVVELGQGTDLLGHWIPAERRVLVRSTLNRDVAWLTFWHELTHSWLEDSGAANLFSPRQQEVIADAIATGLVRLMAIPPLPPEGDA